MPSLIDTTRMHGWTFDRFYTNQYNVFANYKFKSDKIYVAFSVMLHVDVSSDQNCLAGNDASHI